MRFRTDRGGIGLTAAGAVLAALLGAGAAVGASVTLISNVGASSADDTSSTSTAGGAAATPPQGPSTVILDYGK